MRSLNDMLPVYATDGEPSRALGNSELCRDGFYADKSRLVHLTHLSHHILGKFRAAIAFAFRLSSPAPINAVVGVVLHCPQIQMLGIAARWIIAFVKHVHAIRNR